MATRAPFSKGERVRWENLATKLPGTGICIADEIDGHVAVAVDPIRAGDEHRVIWCAWTWIEREA